MAQQRVLPALPVGLDQLLPHLEKHEKTPTTELFKPFRDYDAKIRELYAQKPDSLLQSDKNVVSVFDGPCLTARTRDVASENAKEKECYIMPLVDDDRRASGSPATVASLKEFKNNFSVFTEMALSELDWSNVVVAGSAALTPLLPVPEKSKESKRALRQYYHEELAPASDVDLFLYGLNEEEAKEKIKQIEAKIRDSILQEVTCIRTKNAITIASQYPTRHIQIVLRIYRDISEILTGFDVDCSCVAFDGEKVWAAPRAVQALMTQCNHVDLSRRSPSYENRLSKYSRRGFEIYFSDLDRSKVDPTIFERSFMRTVGLARLLVLEKLPSSSERDNYANLRRKERGRPEMNLWRRNMHKLKGNIKGEYEDEISDWWVDQEDVSDYHTFTIPYGPKFNAKKIEKLLYTKDLLLNAEWNKPKDREVNLHRHPAFFGFADDVFQDCCGHCPEPVTAEEIEAAEAEGKIYVKGEISFMKDDPGRQSVGSFNPITDTDWTEMAYVGNTARLCAAIVDGDVDHVRGWLQQDDADPNQRDHTGRTPLQLAVSSSTPEIVQALIDADARLVARLANGYTALHLACERGDVAIIKSILERSERNEAEHEEKEASKKEEQRKARETDPSTPKAGLSAKEEHETAQDENEDESDVEDDEDEDEDWGSEAESTSMATESFVNVKNKTTEKVEALPDDNNDEPDFYDVNVTSWDLACSPLHLAILNAHIDAVKTMVDVFGADVLLPVKLLNDYDKSPRAAILTLVLALTLPQDAAQQMAKTLLDLGASSRQADLNGHTALQYYVCDGAESFDFLLANDEASAKAALNHIAVSKNSWSPSTSSALLSAISNSDTLGALKILETGVAPDIPFPLWVKEAKTSMEGNTRSRLTSDPNYAMNMYRRSVEQPIVVAVGNDVPDLALALLEAGADPNSLPKTSAEIIESSYNYRVGLSILDIVRVKIEKLRNYEGETEPEHQIPIPLQPDDFYLRKIKPGTYKYWTASKKLTRAKKRYEDELKTYNEKKEQVPKGLEEKKDAVKEALSGFTALETALLERGAKTFKELHPNVGSQDMSQDAPYRHYRDIKKPFEMSFQFRTGELHDELRERYFQLYEAAWNGDLQTIKELTLKPQGSEPPLKIAIEDDEHASPLSIAVMQGHIDAAEAMLEICLAQWSPKKTEDNARYTMGQRDEYYDSDESYDSDTDSLDVRVLRRIVDENFTIENVGEVSLQVESHTTPLEYLEFLCPDQMLADGKEIDTADSTGLLDYAIKSDNHKLFSWLLRVGHQYSTLRTESGITPVGAFFNVDVSHLRNAIGLGRIAMIGELIRHCGCGIPFDELVKKSGVKSTQKPKYYQGLSVYGKKRSDWAAAGRRTQAAKRSGGSSVSPLLIAAKKGSLESLEYLLSDTPVRLYHEFAKENGDDKRVKKLAQAEGGIEKAITDWYYANEASLIPSVVVGKAGVDADKRLEYLINAFPKALDVKLESGETPLQLAFKLGRHSAAKILLAAGADSATRDKAANNLVHKLLENFSTSNKNHTVDKLSSMLDLLSGKVRLAMLAQRNAATAGGGTPIQNFVNASGRITQTRHYWAYDSRDRFETDEKDTTLDVVNALLSYTDGGELSLINGSGDTLLHNVISARKIEFVKLLVEKDSSLLYRENATGRTPLELAHDLYTAAVLGNPPEIASPHNSSYMFGYNNNDIKTLTDHNPDTFVRDKQSKRGDQGKIWDFCSEAASKHPGARRLVSLNEANEVARRVGEMAAVSKKDARKARLAARGYVVNDDEEEEQDRDIVAEWLNDGVAWEG